MRGGENFKNTKTGWGGRKNVDACVAKRGPVRLQEAKGEIGKREE